MILDVPRIIQMIADYGLTLLLAAIFIYIIIKLIQIGFKVFESKIQLNQHDKKLRIRDEVSARIQGLISDYLNTHLGHRIQVIEFSNSVTSVVHLPFKYMSCTYEAVTLGRHGSGKLVDKISVSLFTQFFDNLDDDEVIQFDLHNKRRLMGGAMYDLLVDMNEDKCLCTLLQSTGHKFAIGYLAFYKDGEFTFEDKRDLLQLRTSIELLLSIEDTHNYKLLQQ